MLESTQVTEQLNRNKPILSYRKNSRMAGSVAVWTKQTAAKNDIEKNLSQTEKAADPSQKALAYAASDQHLIKDGDDSFGFADLLDMINPLQHIPLVNALYQNITGDEIKSISQIVGGALFGGVAGAGSALVNVVVEEATGQNIVGNVLSLAAGNSVSFKNPVSDNPEERLNKAVYSVAHGMKDKDNNLPGSVMSFVDLGGGKRKIYQIFNMDEERTAGSMTRISTGLLAEKPAREPITQISLSPWPKL